MKALYYIKTTLKGMISNGVVTIAYFIAFPILMACFMGFFQNTVHENPLKIKPVKIEIVDEDNTESSSKLVSFLKSNYMNEIVNVVDKESEAQIVIEKGYEKNVLGLNKGNIIINKNEEGRDIAIKTLQVVLDKYHKNLYVDISGGDIEKLDKFSESQIIKNITIDTIETASSYEKIATSMMGFVIIMLIFSTIQSGYADISVNLYKRVNSTPITKLQYLFYDTAALIVYVFIILFAYVMFFRLLGISFTGSLSLLMVLLLITTVLIVSVAETISTMFGAKYGKLVGTIVFTLPLISGEIFTGEGNKFALMSPTHYINNAFSLFNLNGSLNGCWKWLISILAISLVIYLIAVLKVGVNWGRKKVCA